jgi:hypothetical protein
MILFAAVELFRHSFNPLDWVAFGVTYAFFSYLFPTELQNYDLEIGDDVIRLVRNGVVRRTLQKGRVRYVREWNDGERLVISEHGPVWTRLLWGGIAVPKSVADYGEIKARVLSWL